MHHAKVCKHINVGSNINNVHDAKMGNINIGDMHDVKVASVILKE